MRWWQWTACAVLLFVVLSLLDGLTRSSLQGDVEVTELESTQDTDTLIVYVPGLLADGEWSARRLVDSWRRRGDVWLVNPTGNRFNVALLVDKLEQMLVTDTHRRVWFIGSSLGAFNVLDVLEQLPDEKFESMDITLFPVCSPSGGVRDIQQPLKAVSVMASVFRFGRFTNATWGNFFTKSITGDQPRTFPMTYYIDQVNYVRSQPDPDQELLATINVINLQAMHDEIVEQSAVEAWTTDDSKHVRVDSKHVAYDADPEKWNRGFDEAFALADTL